MAMTLFHYARSRSWANASPENDLLDGTTSVLVVKSRIPRSKFVSHMRHAKALLEAHLQSLTMMARGRYLVKPSRFVG